MTDLDIAQLEKKIQQLPPQLAVEVNDYVDFLLQKYRYQLSLIVTDETQSRFFEENLPRNKSLLGCLQQYAHPESISEESHAWQNSLGIDDDSH